MAKKLPPLEIRLTALGVTRLAPEESSRSIRIRATRSLLDELERMTAEERGRLLEHALQGQKNERKTIHIAMASNDFLLIGTSVSDLREQAARLGLELTRFWVRDF